jgi:DNA-binding MarR family transcriptional regulator
MSNFSSPVLPCLCASLRRAARATTQLYEQELRPTGLSSSQFTILQALSLMKELTQGQLARALAMDSTSLTRTLAIMSRNGWIEKQSGEDRRERRLKLSNAGEKLFRTALPCWERAQMQLKQRLSRGQANALMQLTQQVTDAAVVLTAQETGGMQ